MPISVNCPSCSQPVQLPEESSGQKVECPLCGSTFVVDPAGGTSAATAVNEKTPAADPAASGMESDPSVNVKDPTFHKPVDPSVPPPLDGATADSPGGDPREDLVLCPYCGESISRRAVRCRFCKESLDEEDERPWEQSRRSLVRRDCEPHRGALILTLGIVSIVIPVAGLICGILAWTMGRRDLQKIKTRVMDPEGEGLTQAGWICGIIGTILDSMRLLCCLGYIGFNAIMITTFMSMPKPAPPAPPRTIPSPPPQRQFHVRKFQPLEFGFPAPNHGRLS